MNIDELIQENTRRKLLRQDSLIIISYKKVKIKGCRKMVDVPLEMLNDKLFSTQMTLNEYEMLRFKYDFEFWCLKCVRIKNKLGGDDNIPFVLNAPQRRVLSTFEKMRVQNEPIRVIMLKARQWGGSTLVQIYMAWIQLVLCRNWNSLICAHVKDSSSTIKGMYSKLLKDYPKEYLEDGLALKFRTFEKSVNMSEIVGRNCVVVIGSSINQDAIRGADIAMAHLSEVAFWRKSPKSTPEDLIRAVCAPIALIPLSLIVLESTANGVGNYFHTEWIRATAGTSDKTPIFVPWHEIEIYSKEVKDAQQVWNAIDEYELKLWEDGLTLEQIYWYQSKRSEYSTHQQMMAEYPTDAVEAFTATNQCVFANNYIERLRENCVPPKWIGELQGYSLKGIEALNNLHFKADTLGCLKVWKMPQDDSIYNNRYVVAVDVGGRSVSSDYSVIAVFDRIAMVEDGVPEVVAQWRGHCDHDLLAWKATQIARWYQNAILAIESNTMEAEYTEGDHAESILDEIGAVYRNMYYRKSINSECERIGFHTNRSTKTMVVNSQIAMLRDGGYIERDSDAVAEYSVFEQKKNGAFGAKIGYHDDIFMTRAIGLYVCYHYKRLYRTPLELKL